MTRIGRTLETSSLLGRIHDSQAIAFRRRKVEMGVPHSKGIEYSGAEEIIQGQTRYSLNQGTQNVD